MKARIRLTLEEEFDFDVEVVEHDALPYQINNFRGLSKEDQLELTNSINEKESAVLTTRVNAAKRAEEIANSLASNHIKVLSVLVEEVSEVQE